MNRTLTFSTFILISSLFCNAESGMNSTLNSFPLKDSISYDAGTSKVLKLKKGYNLIAELGYTLNMEYLEYE